MDTWFRGGLFTTKMKYVILFLIFFLLPLVNAESTFFDQDDAFIMGSSTSGGTSSGIGGGGTTNEILNKSNTTSNENNIPNPTSYEEPINTFIDEKPTNYNNLGLLTILLLLCLSACIFKFWKEIKSLINGLNKTYDNNSVKGLINKKVYTDKGNKVGHIEEVILHRNRIYSLRVILNKVNKFAAKGVIIKYRNVKSIGKIVIVDSRVFDKLRKHKDKF